MTDTEQPEALQMADRLERNLARTASKLNAQGHAGLPERMKELEEDNSILVQGYNAARLEIESLKELLKHKASMVNELKSRLDAIGAGGVEPLRSRCLHQIAEPAVSSQQDNSREDASYASLSLAEMVLSDCGHSSNYTPLLERVAGRIDRHVERLLTAQQADRAMLAAAPNAEPADPLQQLTELSERAGLYDADFKKPSVAPSVTRFNPADGSPETALQIAAVIALHDADKPAGEYPPLPAPAQGEPWYGHHFKEVRRGYWQCGCGKAIAEAAPATSKDSYPPLPNRYTYDDDGAELFTAVQMRAYVDADRTMRAQAAPENIRSILVQCREFIDTTLVPAYPAGADLADKIDALLAAQAEPAAAPTTQAAHQPAAQPGDATRAAARALSDRVAEMCNVDKEDHWKHHSDDVLSDAELVISTYLAAQAQEKAPNSWDDLPKKLMEAARHDALTQADRVAIGRAIVRIQAAAPVAQGDALDTARLDWLTFNISGKALRDIGVVWSEHGDARRAIDAARSQAKEGGAA